MFQYVFQFVLVRFSVRLSHQVVHVWFFWVRLSVSLSVRLVTLRLVSVRLSTIYGIIREFSDAVDRPQLGIKF